MADSVPRAAGYEVGFLSKQREEWVLVTHVREETASCAASRSRPSSASAARRRLLIGVASFVRTGTAEPAAEGRRCATCTGGPLLAFPDEDVLVGTRMLRRRRLTGPSPA